MSEANAARATSDLRRDLDAIVAAGIASVDPGRLLEQALAHDTTVRNATTIRVLAVGKAAAGMATAAARLLGARIVEAVAIAPSTAGIPAPFEAIAGGHPHPTTGSERAGRRAAALADATRPGDLLLCLLSGGASALMVLPADGITLEDKVATTGRLLRAGADITTLNAVRKHLSALKGGWLAARHTSDTHTLAISDVVGDDLSVIGSGPTVADSSFFSDAVSALERFGGVAAYPPSVVARLQAGARGAVPETPKSLDPRLARSTATVIGGRVTAMEAACAKAERLGYEVWRIDAPVVGEAREAGRRLLDEMTRRLQESTGRVCFVASGETTVRVTGSGRGGRNQELALAAVDAVASLERPAAFASIGTDGIDGPTDAAGAIVDRTTRARALRAGLDPSVSLSNNDSHAFFLPLGDLVATGHTGTNVGDLQVFVAAGVS